MSMLRRPKLAEQASIEILEARRAARNYILFQDPEYLRGNQESLAKVRQFWLALGTLSLTKKPSFRRV